MSSQKKFHFRTLWSYFFPFFSFSRGAWRYVIHSRSEQIQTMPISKPFSYFISNCLLYSSSGVRQSTHRAFHSVQQSSLSFGETLRQKQMEWLAKKNIKKSTRRTIPKQLPTPLKIELDWPWGIWRVHVHQWTAQWTSVFRSLFASMNRCNEFIHCSICVRAHTADGTHTLPPEITRNQNHINGLRILLSPLFAWPSPGRAEDVRREQAESALPLQVTKAANQSIDEWLVRYFVVGRTPHLMNVDSYWLRISGGWSTKLIGQDEQPPSRRDSFNTAMNAPDGLKSHTECRFVSDFSGDRNFSKWNTP